MSVPRAQWKPEVSDYHTHDRFIKSKIKSAELAIMPEHQSSDVPR